jgi:hypothetical protein
MVKKKSFSSNSQPLISLNTNEVIIPSLQTSASNSKLYPFIFVRSKLLVRFASMFLF